MSIYSKISHIIVHRNCIPYKKLKTTKPPQGTRVITECRLRIIIVNLDLFCKTVAHRSIVGVISFAHQNYLTMELKKGVYQKSQVVF